MSSTYRIVVGERGRVVLPAELRARANLVPGTALTVVETTAGLVLLTREQLLTRVRVDLRDLDLVSELLNERRVEALREDVGEVSP